MSKQRPKIISRGPEIIPRDTSSWQYEAYLQGRRFYEPVLPGQRVPEGAGQKELDRLAEQRRDELAAEAAAQATAEITDLELPEPELEPEQPGVGEVVAA
jgi:hypothetical protein